MEWIFWFDSLHLSSRIREIFWGFIIAYCKTGGTFQTRYSTIINLPENKENYSFFVQDYCIEKKKHLIVIFCRVRIEPIVKRKFRLGKLFSVSLKNKTKKTHKQMVTRCAKVSRIVVNLLTIISIFKGKKRFSIKLP